MADEGYLVQLYDSEGGYVADATTDQDLKLAANREFVIDSGGKIYKYSARTDQWREVAGVITLSSSKSDDDGKADAKSESKSKSA